jgi:hypothetical protein
MHDLTPRKFHLASNYRHLAAHVAVLSVLGGSLSFENDHAPQTALERVTTRRSDRAERAVFVMQQKDVPLRGDRYAVE